LINLSGQSCFDFRTELNL